MEDTKPHYDDEIDLVELAQTVWEGKWKIVAVVAFSVLSVFGFQTIQPQPNFEASTEIKPITSVEAERYRQSNALGFFEVSPNTLLNLYIEQLDERTLFEAKKNECADALKEVKRLCKEFSFTAGMLKGSLAEGIKSKPQ